MPNTPIAYSSFFWSVGTTSFRTKGFNYSIEKLLDILNQFWQIPEYANIGWDEINNSGECRETGDELNEDGSLSIYGIKNRFYDFARDNHLVSGDDAVKYKAAREITSGLVDMGLIDENRRITDAGRALLTISKSGNYQTDNDLGISSDSFIYLKQLLKMCAGTNETVRPVLVTLYLLSKLNELSNEEFTYLAPLCTNDDITQKICDSIIQVRKGQLSVNDIIIDRILQLSNYNAAYKKFMSSTVTEDLILEVGFNRKSRQYDKPYWKLYKTLKAVYLDKNDSQVYNLYLDTVSITIGRLWRAMLFDNSKAKQIQREGRVHLLPTAFDSVSNEQEFKDTFFRYLHLFKVKATLHDYYDLNRRYLMTSNIFHFKDGAVTLDLVPKHFFNSVIQYLYSDAFVKSPDLHRNCSLVEINPALVFNPKTLIASINKELGTSFTDITEVNNEVEHLRYKRFKKLIASQFTDEVLLSLLDCFESRQDKKIYESVTDNADVPTIFEYILGIIWYKTSGEEGKILDYLKLSLDADLLPITHAAGGEADIVYNYPETYSYPKHCLLLEATLAEETNQRRMEMEPVSRHLGNHLLKTDNNNSYCVFVSPYLHPNVISDFRCRKYAYYFDTSNHEHFITSMNIIPLETADLKQILIQRLHYSDLYSRFVNAYHSDEKNPYTWYNNQVKIPRINTEVQ